MNFKRTMNNEELTSKIVHLMQTDNSSDAPADSVKWAKNLFRARAARPEKSLVQKVLAVLQMDLSPGQTAFGERSASASAVRQMLFSAGDDKIDLRITKNKRGFTVAGQILGGDFDGAEISFFNENRTFTTKSNKLSEFKFENIAKGKYNFSLTSKIKEIVIENIEIG